MKRQTLEVVKIDLSKSQKACYALDSKEGITVPEEEWFWHVFQKENTERNVRVEEEEEEEEEENEENDDEADIMDVELSVQDKLRLLTLYLRRTYCYCIWCGTQFDDDKDLQQECPGPTREDH
uniref:G patch domain-containing protein 11 n=1 Tax=Triatoma infestans TaxID=30076 RepID=A0A170WIA8_TRIIF